MNGEEFNTDNVFIPEVFLSARAMNKVLSVLGSYLGNGKKEVTGRVLMRTVRRDTRLSINCNVYLRTLRKPFTDSFLK
jgi:methanogenic corrinoid protein MtbC1